MTKSLSPEATASDQVAARQFRTRALVTQLADQATCLALTHGAYAALEQLITPAHLDELQENLNIPRAQLGALLNILNAELKHQIHGIADAATVLHALTSAQANPNPMP